MSYEITVRFLNEISASTAMSSLRMSPLLLRTYKENVLLKDPMLKSTAEYDVAVEQNINVLDVEINFKTLSIYEALTKGFAGLEYICHDETDTLITLEELFRGLLKNPIQ